jgi:formylglycine-generating enzyme required for sulfatase activity
VTLPTEAQWDYACRAGNAGPLYYGGLDTDFSAFANMAEATIRELAYDTDGRHTADLVPRDARFDDHALVTVDVGSYQPNAWGLYDVHGNAWEWTRSAYRPYPYVDDDGRNDPPAGEPVVARGGSWRDRPLRCRSGFRPNYPAWQRIYNVGFRVVCQVAGPLEVVQTEAAKPR